MKPEAVVSGTPEVYSKRSPGGSGGCAPTTPSLLPPAHALALRLLLPAGGVGDDPVPRLELHGLVAGIGDDDGVGPEITGAVGRRLPRNKVRLDGHFDLAGHGAVHDCHHTEICSGTKRRRRFWRHRPARIRREVHVQVSLHAIRALCEMTAGPVHSLPRRDLRKGF